jgi:putative membrane protein
VNEPDRVPVASETPPPDAESSAEASVESSVESTGEPAADPSESGLPATDLRRLHPLTPLLRGWKFFAVAVAVLGQDALRDFNLKLFGIQLGGAIVLGILLGLLSWWFTKYRIEGDVLRVDSGFLFRRSRRIRLDRLQAVDIVRPVLARVLGVAELRLEVAGGGRTEAPLAYLSEAGAHKLRAELLARAAGLDADTPEAPESRLVSVPASVLFASTILSAPFLVSLLGFAGVAVTTVYLREIVGLAFLVPWALGGIGVLWQQFVSEYGFTVSESPDGLRIRKGLLDTVAQTVPPGRVQGVEIEQQFLWRPNGWVRLSVDVAGYGRGDNDGQKSSTLLPVAPWPVARGLLQRILPGVDVDSVPRVMAPRSARWLRPIGWRYLRHGVDERVFVTDRGWLTKRIAVVPHAKMQSVRIEQGPLQRRLGLATVHVDTPDGPVNAAALHRDAGDRARGRRTRGRAVPRGPADRRTRAVDDLLIAGPARASAHSARTCWSHQKSPRPPGATSSDCSLARASAVR